MSRPQPGPYELASTYLRLRPDATVEPLPVDETFWPRLMQGELGTFHREYLVTTFGYDRDWPTWEMHPNGDEVVVLLDGHATFVLEIDGRERLVALGKSGAYVVVPRGTWHTARTASPCRMLFITAGEGTQIRQS
jgi:mannose-6-phosphate isomerase-like protein (cupin superfamily)